MTKTQRSSTNLMAFLMERPYYSWLLVGLFALSPITNWLAMAICALCTLRNGGYAGLKCFAIAITAAISITAYHGADLLVFILIASNYLLCYLLAMMLRNAITWQQIAYFVGSLALVIILLGHWFIEPYLIDTMKDIIKSMGNIDPQNPMLALSQSSFQIELAHYFWGIRISAYMLGPVVSLLFARSLQSQLYYPGGFREEIYKFHAHPLVSGLFLVCLAGIYFKNIYAVAIFPVFFFYLLMAGILFMFRMLQNQKKWLAALVVFAPLFLLPYIFLLVYAILGLVDGIKELPIFKRS